MHLSSYETIIVILTIILIVMNLLIEYIKK